jgi:deazaflavin-dependent oxidoreductase (nitroreductase family)
VTARARSPRRRAARRIWNAGAWLPVLADRPGFRWMLSGRLVGAPILVLTHRGRRSGRVYRTPLEVIAEDAGGDEIVVAPMRGRRGDWYLNVLAGGLVQVSLRGESFEAEWRELPEDERRAALESYGREHGAYGRFVLRALVRLNDLRGDPLAEVARAIPALALRRVRP